MCFECLHGILRKHSAARSLCSSRHALRAEGLVVERADALGGRAVLLTVRAGDADSE